MRVEVDPVRIARQQFLLQFLSRQPPLTSHTAHQVEPPMQIHNVGAARGLMQAIDILGNKQGNTAALLEGG